MDLDGWLEAHRGAMNLLYSFVIIAAAVIYTWAARNLVTSTRRHVNDVYAVFADAVKESLINATTRGLEERLAALEKIVMEDHLQRIERAPAPPEGEGR